jgi:SAM-dependent methyltransferase
MQAVRKGKRCGTFTRTTRGLRAARRPGRSGPVAPHQPGQVAHDRATAAHSRPASRDARPRLGCGGGDATLRMAALVGAEGEVVGIDLDQSILRLARRQAENLAPPVTFRYLDAEALDEVAAYDFTYARYLMLNLQQPERVFKAMVRALRPGGRLAVEDIFFPGHVCYPPNAAFDRYLELYEAAVRANGADSAIGPRLVGMALDAG